MADATTKFAPPCDESDGNAPETGKLEGPVERGLAFVSAVPFIFDVLAYGAIFVLVVLGGSA